MGDYLEDASLYLSKMTGDPIDQCREFIKQSIIPGGHRALVVPRVKYLQRQANGDRKEQISNFLDYLQGSFASQQIIAPTMTTYVPSAQKQSLLATYIAGNLKRRSAAKKNMFQAEIDGNAELYALLDAQQNTFKVKNNSLSGAHSSPFKPLWNKTAHSTLTSVCRTGTSYANANNEKLLYGNRHYYNPEIVKTNIIAIVRASNLTQIDEIMQKWRIVHPSVDEVMTAIRRSTGTYWRNQEQMDLIQKLVNTLTPTERSAFLYTGDLYNLAIVNESFVKNFISQLSEKGKTVLTSVAEANDVLKKIDDNLKAFISIVVAKELIDPVDQRIKDIKALRKRVEAGEEQAIKNYLLVGSVAFQKLELIDRYGDFISTFLMSDVLPPSVFSVPAMIRRGVLASDTDSTIFTVQWWVEWMQGSLDFSDQAVHIANSMVYIAGQVMRHVLATFCANMGVEQSQIMRLEMKNEYYFPIFALTSRAKHYYGFRGAQEGVVFTKMKPEIKGVALRSSAVASEIIDLAHQTMFDIMNTLMKSERISALAIIRKVATIEREVMEAVANGSFKYFRRTSIKDREAYKDEDGGNYQHYELWQAAFASRYGDAPTPPYPAIAVPLTIDSKRRTMEWLERMEDRTMAAQIQAWMEKRGKLYIGTILLPTMNLLTGGVPKEISSAVDTRSLLAQLMESFYLILEGLGVYVRNKKNTRLISDDLTIESLPESVLRGSSKNN